MKLLAPSILTPLALLQGVLARPRYVIDRNSCKDHFANVKGSMEMAIKWADVAARELPSTPCQPGYKAHLEWGLQKIIGSDPKDWKTVKAILEDIARFQYLGDDYKKHLDGTKGGSWYKLSWEDVIIFCDMSFIRKLDEDHTAKFGEVELDHINVVSGNPTSAGEPLVQVAQGMSGEVALCVPASGGPVRVAPSVIGFNPVMADVITAEQNCFGKLPAERVPMEGETGLDVLMHTLDGTLLTKLMSTRVGGSAVDIPYFQGWFGIRMLQNANIDPDPEVMTPKTTKNAESLVAISLLSHLVVDMGVRVTRTGSLVPFRDNPGLVYGGCPPPKGMGKMGKKKGKGKGKGKSNQG